MARWLDGLGVIFPFERECFKDTELPVEFVGHPFVAKGFKVSVQYQWDAPVLLLPGSRKAAVARIFPVMARAFELCLKEKPDIRAAVIYPGEDIRQVLEEVHLFTPEARARMSLVSSKQAVAGQAVLTSSGTISLLCALGGIPGVIVYRAHPLTYLLGRMMVKVPYLGIANILLKEPFYPEFIQGRAAPEVLARELKMAVDSRERIDGAQEAAERLRQILSAGEEVSAERWLERCLGGE